MGNNGPSEGEITAAARGLRPQILLGSKTYGPFEPYVIAEIGVNHEGSLSRAKDLISAAAEAGADAVKFQTYTAELLAAPGLSPSYWDRNQEPTESQFALFKKLGTFGPEDYAELCAHSSLHDVDFMSTPFDIQAVEVLSALVSVFKVASADLTNIPLIEKIMSYGKPIFISTGASTVDEVLLISQKFDAYEAQVAFLHCVLNYPTKVEDANISGVSSLRNLLGNRFPVGYSDHVAPRQDGSMPALEASFILGASVIEKHFTDDRTRVGNDHYHSMDAQSLRNFLDWSRETRTLMGSGQFDILGQMEARQNARRRIFAGREISENAAVVAEDLLPLRANTGIEVSEWHSAIGRFANRKILPGEPISWEYLSD